MKFHPEEYLLSKKNVYDVERMKNGVKREKKRENELTCTRGRTIRDDSYGTGDVHRGRDNYAANRRAPGKRRDLP